MEACPYSPYRSEAARDSCFRYLDSLAARVWPIVSEERRVATTYGATMVRVSGPGTAPPLVLLHGAGTTSLMWAPNIQALSTERRTFAVDQVGVFGKSLAAKPVRSIGDFLAWLNQLFDGLELRGGIALAGISYGGALAAQYALRFPERIAKLVLLAPANTVLRIGVEFWARLIAVAIVRPHGLRWFFRWVFPVLARKDPKLVDAICEQLLFSAKKVARGKIVVPPLMSDSEWGSLKPPTLFLVGEHEAIYSPVKAVERLRRVAPAVLAEIIPGAGHDLTFVQAEAVDRRILSFLREQAAPA